MNSFPPLMVLARSFRERVLFLNQNRFPGSKDPGYSRPLPSSLVSAASDELICFGYAFVCAADRDELNVHGFRAAVPRFVEIWHRSAFRDRNAVSTLRALSGGGVCCSPNMGENLRARKLEAFSTLHEL